MKKFYQILTIFLAIFLPWHGAMTVFLPENFRYWKEIGLLLFFAGFCWEFWQQKKYNWQNLFLKNRLNFLAILFLLWGGGLVFFSTDKYYALVAFRYLGLGLSVFLLFNLLSTVSEKFREIWQTTFSRFFIYSAVASVFFGVWVKFGNGVSFVQNFYSKTISSWVPGQKIPLWHEAGDFVRLQGGSSGPIEFSHLLVVALFLLLNGKYKKIYKVLFSLIFLFGIWQSASRSAMLASFIILITVNWETLKQIFWKKIPLKKTVKVAIFTSLVMVTLALGGLFLKNSDFLSRAGTSDHFRRPVAVLNFGIKNILKNNLGKIGPAARMKNLRENNDDKAMIAENVFVDIFGQMGIIGLIFYLIFWLNWWAKNWTNKNFAGFGGAVLLMMSLATIFDMTPVAITFFIILGFPLIIREK